jgi:hypothetical protein
MTTDIVVDKEMDELVLESRVLGKQKWYSRIITPLLAIAVIAFWSMIDFSFLYRSVAISEDIKDVVNRMLGQIDAAAMLVLSYYFGNAHKQS